MTPLTLEKLMALATQIEQGTPVQASNANRELTQKCWADIKEFSNALKALSTFKKNYNIQ